MCSHCDKGFSEAGTLKKHVKAVHEGVRNHVCNHCEKSFSQAGHLKIHIKAVHEGVKDHDYKVKRHCCVPLCESYLQRGMFKFPKDRNLKAKWLTAVNLEVHRPGDLVCFKHFREKFDYCMQPRLDTFIYKLSSDAVPSLCLPLKSHLLVNEKIEAKNNHKQRKIQDNTDF